MPPIRKPLRTKKESIVIQAISPTLQTRDDSDFGQKWFRRTIAMRAARKPSSSGM